MKSEENHSKLISFFSDAFQKEPAKALPLSDFLNGIKSGTWEKEIALLRGLLAENKRGDYDSGKRTLAGATISVHCLSRGSSLTYEQKAITHSGWLQADFDLKDNPILATQSSEKRRALLADPHVYCVFVGPSGEGLKAIVAIPADYHRHKAAWLAAEAHFRDVHGLALDKATKDPMRLCFVSHDPDLATSSDFVQIRVSEKQTPPLPVVALHETKSAGHESSPLGHEGVFVPASDADRAKAFVARWQDEILYVTDRAIWLTWEDAWRKDTKGGITRRAIALADETLERVASSPAASKAEIKEKSVALRDCSNLANANSIRAMRSLAESFQEIQVEAKELDANPWLLGTPNAVIDLRTGEAFTHSPSNLVTMFTKAEFRPDATAPRWEKFIEEIFPDEELRWYTWKAFGYAITGSTREKCFHFLIGTGDNGKSKLLECLSSILGDYSGSAAKGLLYANDKGSYPLREAASIVGKRFLVGPETEERDKLNTGLLKRLTGDGDTLDAANLYENQFSFVPCSKLFIMGNHRPGIADTGPAMWRRVRLIPFERVFTPAEQDRTLADKLSAEASGILNWLIRGALVWQREGLVPPAKVTAAVEDYRTDQDTLADFIEECTSHSLHGCVPHGLLFKAYESWAEDSGIRFKLSKKGLAKTLRSKGWNEIRTAESKTVWRGVILNQ